MARITRKTQKIFANGASNNGQFGSRQAGSPLNSADPAIIQNLAAWNTGWLQAVLSGQRLPTLEEMQGLDYVITYQLAYMMQEGIVEYDAGTTYYINSIVKAPGTYQLFGSLTDNNTGNALPTFGTNNANWKSLIDLGAPLTYATQAQAQAGTDNTTAMTPLRTFQSIQSYNSLNYACFLEQLAQGTAGTGTIGTDSPRILNTTKSNGIAGLTLNTTTGEITFTNAGTFNVQAFAMTAGSSSGNSKIRILNTTTSAFIAEGSDASTSASNAAQISVINDVITVAAGQKIKLTHFVSAGGFGSPVSRGPETYAGLTLTKVA